MPAAFELLNFGMAGGGACDWPACPHHCIDDHPVHVVSLSAGTQHLSLHEPDCS